MILAQLVVAISRAAPGQRCAKTQTATTTIMRIVEAPEAAGTQHRPIRTMPAVSASSGRRARAPPAAATSTRPPQPWPDSTASREWPRPFRPNQRNLVSAATFDNEAIGYVQLVGCSNRSDRLNAQVPPRGWVLAAEESVFIVSRVTKVSRTAKDPGLTLRMMNWSSTRASTSGPAQGPSQPKLVAFRQDGTHA